MVSKSGKRGYARGADNGKTHVVLSDLLVEAYEPIGGLNMLVFTTELSYPLSKALGLKVAAFYDVGKGFERWDEITPLRHAVGGGIRWYSPLGPIRVDWGYNLGRKRERGEKTSVSSASTNWMITGLCFPTILFAP